MQKCWRKVDLELSRSIETEQNGFTLVEIVVTIAILGISLPPLLNAFTSGARGQALAENRTTALYLLKYKMGEVEAEGFPEVRTEEGEFDGNDQYTWSITVVDIDSEELEGLRQVTVSVFWQYRQKEKSMSLQTLVSDRQIQEQQNQGQSQGNPANNIG